IWQQHSRDVRSSQTSLHRQQTGNDFSTDFASQPGSQLETQRRRAPTTGIRSQKLAATRLALTFQLFVGVIARACITCFRNLFATFPATVPPRELNLPLATTICDLR